MKNLKRTITLVTLLMSLTAFQTSYGQEESGSKIGLGASLFNYTDYAYVNGYSVSNSIYVTFDFDNKFRFEPSFGFTITNSDSYYSVSLGAFGKKTISQFNFLYGLRLGVNKNEIFSIAPTIGGEYYFIKHFSIGSEVQLKGLINNGNYAVVTNSSVIVRFYF